MPDSKDVAALPTSWALTLWDTVPLYFSLEAAFVILAIALFNRPWREAIWHNRKVASPGGAAILALFSPALSLLYGAFAALGIGFIYWPRRNAVSPDTRHRPESPAPESPLQAIRTHLGKAVFPVVIAAAAAAFVKVILDPSSDWPGLAWFTLAIPIGALFPGGPGPAAITAGALSQSPGGIAASAALVASSTLAEAFRVTVTRPVAVPPEPVDG